MFLKGGPHNSSLSLDRALKKQSTRYFWNEHNSPPPDARGGFHYLGFIPSLELWWWRKYITVRIRARIPAKILAVSTGVSQQLMSAYGYPEERVTVIPNGIDASNFYYSDERRCLARQSWGVDNDICVIGYVGRLEIAQKATDLLLSAFAHFAQSRPDTHLVLVGGGEDRTTLEEMARTLGVQERVHFVGPFAHPEIVYSGFDVFVSSSRFEGSAFTILEAMASERLCVATNVGGAPDALGRDGVGIVVAVNSVEALSAGLLKAVKLSSAERSQLGKRARQVVIERLSDRESFGTYCDWLEGREPKARS